jgi:hypothetical protein
LKNRREDEEKDDEEGEGDMRVGEEEADMIIQALAVLEEIRENAEVYQDLKSRIPKVRP